jgi:four helix bundle protein
MKTKSATEQDRRWRFEHHGLDAYAVALEALVEGDRIAQRLPRGYGKLKEQLQRALQGAFLQTAEAAARRGDDRRSRFRIARAEAGEAAAAIEALGRMTVIDPNRADRVLELLWRLCAMLCRLGNLAPGQ